MELGISTFGEIVADNTSGKAVNAQKRAQELIIEAQLADKIGIDVYALGEHHRPDYLISYWCLFDIGHLSGDSK